MKLGAARFVAGETLDECVAVLRGLDERGSAPNTTLLGEDVADRSEARAVADRVRGVLRAPRTTRGCATNVALKLTHLGLDLGEEVAYENLRARRRRAPASSATSSASTWSTRPSWT